MAGQESSPLSEPWILSVIPLNQYSTKKKEKSSILSSQVALSSSRDIVVKYKTPVDHILAFLTLSLWVHNISIEYRCASSTEREKNPPKAFDLLSIETEPFFIRYTAPEKNKTNGNKKKKTNIETSSECRKKRSSCLPSVRIAKRPNIELIETNGDVAKKDGRHTTTFEMAQHLNAERDGQQ